MRITRTGKGHYLAYSETIPGVAYSVDLTAHDFLGDCTCKDFEARKYPRWKLNPKRLDAYRCKHIRRIRNYVLDLMMEHIKRQDEEIRRNSNAGR